MSRSSHGIMGFAAALLVALGATGCPGDGSELGMIDGGGIEPTLSSIQVHVFSAICTDCHVPGGTGPMPLDSEDASFANLVDVPSFTCSSLDRVEPGDVEASCLVHKITGSPVAIGDRMPPPPQPALSAEQIQAIRDWIAAGAPR